MWNCSYYISIFISKIEKNDEWDDLIDLGIQNLTDHNLDYKFKVVVFICKKYSNISLYQLYLTVRKS
jgi:hypothetical protein